jgi:hypothetical protein
VAEEAVAKAAIQGVGLFAFCRRPGGIVFMFATHAAHAGCGARANSRRGNAARGNVPAVRRPLKTDLDPQAILPTLLERFPKVDNSGKFTVKGRCETLEGTARIAKMIESG